MWCGAGATSSATMMAGGSTIIAEMGHERDREWANHECGCGRRDGRHRRAERVTEQAIQHRRDRARSDRACIEQCKGAFGAMRRGELGHRSVENGRRAVE